MLPRCPFVRAGSDVSECSGYAPVDVDLAEFPRIGDDVTAWQTCRFLGAETHGRLGGFYPACHHPDGVPTPVSGRVEQAVSPRGRPRG